MKNDKMLSFIAWKMMRYCLRNQADNALSLIVFEIFEKNAHMTFGLGPRSKVMAPYESPYTISYMSTIQTESLSFIVFEIFEKNAHMTFDLGSRSKVMAPN